MDGIGNFLGGLLTGFTQTVQQQRERQVQDEYKKALIEQSKLQTKQLENKLKLAEQEAGMKNAFFQNVLGPLMGGGGQMPMAPPQGPLPAEGFQLPKQPSGPYGAAPPGAAPGPVSAIPQPRATGGGYFADLVNEASQKYGVNPWLIEAVIKNESGGNPRAVSPKGAQGLMQLMPGTAQGLGVTDPFDPRQNIMGGANYLKQQLDRFGGDIPKAIAAYNAGPGAVEKHGGIPPYAETQQFVRNVMAGAPAQPQPMQAQAPGGRMNMENLTPEQRFAVDIGGMMILDKDLGLRKEKGFAGTVDLGNATGLLDKQGNVTKVIPKSGQEYFTYQHPSGAEVTDTRPKYPGAPGGGLGGTPPPMVTKLPEQLMPKGMPEAVKEKVVRLENFANQLTRLKQMATPEVFGILPNMQFKAGETALGAVIPHNPQLIAFMKIMKDIENKKVHEFGGSNLTAQELQRALASLPRTWNQGAFHTAVDALIAASQEDIADMYGAYAKPESIRAREAQTPSLKAFQNKGAIKSGQADWVFDPRTGKWTKP